MLSGAGFFLKKRSKGPSEPADGDAFQFKAESGQLIYGKEKQKKYFYGTCRLILAGLRKTVAPETRLRSEIAGRDRTGRGRRRRRWHPRERGSLSDVGTHMGRRSFRGRQDRLPDLEGDQRHRSEPPTDRVRPPKVDGGPNEEMELKFRDAPSFGIERGEDSWERYWSDHYFRSG